MVTPYSLLVKGGEASFGPLPLKSEVGYALTRGAFAWPFGELHPRPFGTTPKSSVRPSMVADFFRDLEKEWCGEEGYWRPPRFQGEMREGVWWSPYQDALLSHRGGAAQDACLIAAVLDYCSVFSALESPARRELSEHEVIRGVPGRWVNPINWRTSCGPPWN